MLLQPREAGNGPFPSPASGETAAPLTPDGSPAGNPTRRRWCGQNVTFIKVGIISNVFSVPRLLTPQKLWNNICVLCQDSKLVIVLFTQQLKPNTGQVSGQERIIQ